LTKPRVLAWLAPFLFSVSASAQTVVATMHQPFGLSIDPSGNLWVEQYNDAIIDIVSPKTKKLIKAIAVAPQPTQPAFFDGLAIYSSEYGKTVYALNAKTYAVQYSIPIVSPAIANVVVGPNGIGYIASDPNSVTAFNPSNGAIVGVVVTGLHPRGVAFSADGSIMAVASRSANVLDLIDVANMKVARTASVGASPRAVAIVGKNAFTANYDDNTVTKVDLATGEVLATIPVGPHPRRFAVSGVRLFVSNEDGNSISVIDTDTDKIVKTIDVGSSPRNIAVDARGERLFVADYEADRVLAYDLKNAR
jgi:YVTN family beta-propeller protein